jgi:hypothetical protein
VATGKIADVYAESLKLLILLCFTSGNVSGLADAVKLQVSTLKHTVFHASGRSETYRIWD